MTQCGQHLIPQDAQGVLDGRRDGPPGPPGQGRAGTPPVSTTVEVSKPFREGALLEVEVTAAVPAR